jgi:ABC-type sugar transport system ATPase subunit
VRFDGVQKAFGSAFAVRGLDLDIRGGEFLSLLGPSGCGKTTTLRMLAGLEFPTSGTISIGGRVVNEVAPGARDVAMVFQSYALYPHMTVAENIAYPLRSAASPGGARAARGQGRRDAAARRAAAAQAAPALRRAAAARRARPRAGARPPRLPAG